MTEWYTDLKPRVPGIWLQFLARCYSKRESSTPRNASKCGWHPVNSWGMPEYPGIPTQTSGACPVHFTLQSAFSKCLLTPWAWCSLTLDPGNGHGPTCYFTNVCVGNLVLACQKPHINGDGCNSWGIPTFSGSFPVDPCCSYAEYAVFIAFPCWCRLFSSPHW